MSLNLKSIYQKIKTYISKFSDFWSCWIFSKRYVNSLLLRLLSRPAWAVTKQRTFCGMYLHHLMGEETGSVVKKIVT